VLTHAIFRFAERYALRRVGNLYHIAIEDYIAFAKQHIAKGESMDNKTIKELAVELTVEITVICDRIKGRSVFVNQLLRSCSSIGANAHEARYAQSTADFINKLEIALKECYETEYWLEILFKVNAINDITYKALISKSGTIRRKLIASITTAKVNKDNSGTVSCN
jgi:four helix bundle protein